MKTAKRCLAVLLLGVMALCALAGCGDNADAAGFDDSQEIGVITREDGSGTRGAFIELFGIEQKNDAGEKIDCTTDAAAVTNSTAVMMTTVAGDVYSISGEGLYINQTYATAVVLLVVVVAINALSGFAANKLGGEKANG